MLEKQYAGVKEAEKQKSTKQLKFTMVYDMENFSLKKLMYKPGIFFSITERRCLL